MTYEEKLEWAWRLRRDAFSFSMAPPGYMDVLKKADRKEISVRTGEGESRCFLVDPPGGALNDILLINLHGGGFVKGHTVWDDALCAQYACRIGCRVLDIDYCLAPENPFPAAMNECYGIIQWAFSHAQELHISGEKIALCGYSAGAALAISAGILANERAGRMPGFILAVYPPADSLIEGWTPDSPSNPDPTRMDEISWVFSELYTGADPSLAPCPHVHLAKARPSCFSGFPQTLLLTAAEDPLRFGGQKLAEKIAAAGAEVIYKEIPDSGHGFYVRCRGRWKEAHALFIRVLMEKWCGQREDRGEHDAEM